MGVEMRQSGPRCVFVGGLVNLAAPTSRSAPLTLTDRLTTSATAERQESPPVRGKISPYYRRPRRGLGAQTPEELKGEAKLIQPGLMAVWGTDCSHGAHSVATGIASLSLHRSCWTRDVGAILLVTARDRPAGSSYND